LRIDQLDRAQSSADVITYPKIIHFGIRPAQLSYAGDATYVFTNNNNNNNDRLTAFDPGQPG